MVGGTPMFTWYHVQNIEVENTVTVT